MQEPTLVILAAGMGSRYGGLKQIAAVDNYGHPIIDFSLFDAHRAGFRKVVFIIKREIEESFKAAIGRRMEKHYEVKYVYQELSKLPAGYAIPEGRSKPWGTGHAVLCCAQEIDGPFAVINADDFYGPTAYTALYDYLAQEHPDTEHAMVAYHLINTVSENGTVARGVCQVENGLLTDVVERTKIARRGRDGAYTEDGENWITLPGDTPVSLNFWGFGKSMLHELEARFPAWLDENLAVNPLKAEYFLPYVANAVIQEGKGTVRVLPCHETWYGITYKEDMSALAAAIERKRRDGIYPAKLLD